MAMIDGATSAANNGYFGFLPQEVILQILGSLSPAQLCAAERVSKFFRKLALDNTLWKRHYSCHFTAKPQNDDQLVNVGSWKNLFKVQINLNKSRCREQVIDRPEPKRQRRAISMSTPTFPCAASSSAPTLPVAGPPIPRHNSSRTLPTMPVPTASALPAYQSSHPAASAASHVKTAHPTPYLPLECPPANHPLFLLMPGNHSPHSLPCNEALLQRIPNGSIELLIKLSKSGTGERTQQLLCLIQPSDYVMVFNQWAFILNPERTQLNIVSLYENIPPVMLNANELSASSTSEPINGVLCFRDSAIIQFSDGSLSYIPRLVHTNKGFDCYGVDPGIEAFFNQSINQSLSLIHFDESRVIFISPGLDCSIEIVDCIQQKRLVLDLRTLPMPAHIIGQPDQISASDYDGKHLALGTKNGKVLIIDITNLTLVNVREAHLLDVLKIRLAGDVFFTLGDKRSLKYWHLKDSLTPYHEELIHVAPSPNQGLKRTLHKRNVKHQPNKSAEIEKQSTDRAATSARHKRLYTESASAPSPKKILTDSDKLDSDQTEPVDVTEAAIYFDGKQLLSKAGNGLIKSRDFLSPAQ